MKDLRSNSELEELRKIIREVPDFPKPGVLFYDVTTLLRVPEALCRVIDLFVSEFSSRDIDLVLGMESRGFIFAPPVAYRLGAGFVPVRKQGKLPCRTKLVSYDLEYGKDALEIHEDAIVPGQKVLVLDDVIATGGTAAATVKMAVEMGAKVVGAAFLIELTSLRGREKLPDTPLFSLLQY
ncbi:MAG: adenine phosphoribosyltransferase [Acidobacteria bacterium]|nr:adenine phosphoribosyltransferase [Acidobacteriota bacterium]